MLTDDDKIEAMELLSSIHDLLYEVRVKSRRLRNILVGNPIMDGRDVDMDDHMMKNVASKIDTLSKDAESAEVNRNSVETVMHDGAVDSISLKHMDDDINGMNEHLPFISEDVEDLI